jgi:hypothetical protein
MLAAVAVPLLALIAGVPFHTVVKGDGGASTIGKRSNLTIKSKTRWADTWDDLGEQGKPKRVNFSKHMLIVVTQARQPSGGREIKVESVSRTASGGYVVKSVETKPGTGCFTPSVITRPFHVVRVPRTSGKVSFVRRQVVVGCD